MSTLRIAVLLSLALPTLAAGQEIVLERNEPRPTPLTRPALKEMLEQVKQRKPRIPLPDLTDQDREQLGDSSENYEQRLKYHFLGENRKARSRSREPDPNMSLPYDFKVQIFWIVSRVNNCHYCIGHQETKLLAAGQTEDQIAALDCKWTSFPASHQVAFDFARTLTFAPSTVSSAQFDALKEHYTEQQILEMVVATAWNNSINRWKEALAVPQNPDEGGYSRAVRGLSPSQAAAFSGLPLGSYLTPTSKPFSNLPSVVTLDTQPAREHGVPVDEIMTHAAQRQPRLPMASESATHECFSEIIGDSERAPLWMRTLAVFPREGLRRAKGILASQAWDALSPLQRARLSWVVGQQDNAGYVMDLARTEMKDLGVWDMERNQLTGDWSAYDRQDRVLLELARDLAHSPVVLSDQQVEQAVKSHGAATVVQAVAHIVGQTALVRLSEAAHLPSESARGSAYLSSE